MNTFFRFKILATRYRANFLRIARLCASWALILSLTACTALPQVKAEERIFRDLSLEFLGEYQLPKLVFDETPVGGLSALTYDPKTARFYALSDDRSAARFYTLNLVLAQTPDNRAKIERVAVEKVTILTDEQGDSFAAGNIDPEGIALSARGTVFIASEGVSSRGINPFIAEFDLESGQMRSRLRLPQRYLLDDSEEATEPRGVRENLGFESLSLGRAGLAAGDPFRLFAAPESSLVQESEKQNPEDPTPIRMLHYGINPIGSEILVAEHLYLLDPVENIGSNGLTELMTLEPEGFLLALERTYTLSRFGAKLYQVAMGDATDISQIPRLTDNRKPIKPLRKRLLLDLQELGIALYNLEGMALGPRLADGSQTLILVSDDNFKENRATQFLLFLLLEARDRS